MMPTSHPNSDREALSALFDGELGGDAARFALKRLDHDQAWRQTCERWSLVGDVLRGQGQALLPAGFPARVLAASATQPRIARAGGNVPRWMRWGGVGLAASVAAAALFFARQTAGLESPAAPAPRVATTPVIPAPAPAPADPAGAPQGQGAMQLASAGLVAVEASRQGVQRARNTQRTRVAQARRSAGRPEIALPAQAVAVAGTPQRVEPGNGPFSGNAADPARPWPRAVLPQVGGSGALTAGFGTASPSFYPFEPRLPAQGEPDPQAAPDASRP